MKRVSISRPKMFAAACTNLCAEDNPTGYTLPIVITAETTTTLPDVDVVVTIRRRCELKLERRCDHIVASLIAGHRILTSRISIDDIEGRSFSEINEATEELFTEPDLQRLID